ncbi:hypothetical protein [Oceanobacter mangrovi]|uniref:hypothetical protein n=1 Tax=Oceanobacter mangrovi TaxID=2862510 RepID=UPI001C8ECAFE|nr:hypothetical protein [Oceanobacter mangrovi]
MMESLSGWTLVLMAVIAVLTAFFHLYRFSARTLDVGPNILTSLGIFGTFLGVALGLSEFDTSDIQASVPTLMEGLKTAFWSSIVGLFGALTIKVRGAIGQLTAVAAKQQGATIADLLAALDKIRLSVSETNQLARDSNPVAALHALQTALASQSDRQHQALMGELEQINHSLENYQERMAEANARALVEAIEMVMTEFNTKINEQYGDNFKRLNESVISMLEWQKSYKGQITELINEQQRGAESMKVACDAFEYMVRHANAFNGISASLEELLSAMETQRDSLQQQLGSLAGLISSAADGLPQLEQRVLSLTQGMATAVEQQQNWLSTELSESQLNLQQQWQQQLAVTQEQIQNQQQQSLYQLQKLGERVERQFVVLDESLEAELNKALKSLGIQLSALSEKFVSDYGPLTDKLQRLVQAAERVNEQ